MFDLAPIIWGVFLCYAAGSFGGRLYKERTDVESASESKDAPPASTPRAQGRFGALFGAIAGFFLFGIWNLAHVPLGQGYSLKVLLIILPAAVSGLVWGAMWGYWGGRPAKKGSPAGSGNSPRTHRKGSQSN